MKWFYDREKKMQYNFVCYDDPIQQFDPYIGDCECLEGFLGADDHCHKCSEKNSCLKCSGEKGQTCVDCISGFTLIDGECSDCDCDCTGKPPADCDQVRCEETRKKCEGHSLSVT